jgi:NAD(P)H dehydrogenase (quinone)
LKVMGIAAMTVAPKQRDAGLGTHRRPTHPIASVGVGATGPANPNRAQGLSFDMFLGFSWSSCGSALRKARGKRTVSRAWRRDSVRRSQQSEPPHSAGEAGIMIVVTGATGQFGRLVVERLLERVPPSEIAVVVRDPTKAADFAVRRVAARRADYDHPDSLMAAFEDADRLLFVSSPVMGGDRSRLLQHRNVVSAALQAGVGTIIYTSGLGADLVEEDVPILGDHRVTENEIRANGMPYVMLRNPLYTELFINADLRSAIEAGELTSNTMGRGMNTARRADLAEAAAVVLTRPNDDVSIYDFTGPLWTYPELAVTLGEVTGHPVSYREVEHDEGAVGFMGLAPLIQSGGFEIHTPDLEVVLGHPAASLPVAVAEALADAA